MKRVLSFPADRRDRRALLLGAMLLIGISGSRAIPAFGVWRDARGVSAVALAGDAARARREIDAVDARRSLLVLRRARLSNLDSALLHAESLAGAAAVLAGLVADLAEGAGVRAEAVQIEPTSEGNVADLASRESYARVAVRASVAGEFESVVELLAALEGDAAMLSIPELALVHTTPPAPDARESIRAELVVEALVRAPALREAK